MTRRRLFPGSIATARAAALIVATACLGGLSIGPAAAQTGAPLNGEWPTYGGDLGSTKYSPLDQIDRSNFGDLEVAWRWTSADGILSLTMPDGSEWRADSALIFEELNQRNPDRWRDGLPPTITNFKATPLMVGGRLFINMPTSQVASIDAATGETLWVYNPKGTVNLSPQVAEYADDEPGAQLPRIPLSTRDHQSHGVALSPLRGRVDQGRC